MMKFMAFVPVDVRAGGPLRRTAANGVPIRSEKSFAL